jgi:hypothetical protein
METPTTTKCGGGENGAPKETCRKRGVRTPAVELMGGVQLRHSLCRYAQLHAVRSQRSRSAAAGRRRPVGDENETETFQVGPMILSGPVRSRSGPDSNLKFYPTNPIANQTVTSRSRAGRQQSEIADFFCGRVQ